MEHAIGRLGHDLLVEYLSGCSDVPRRGGVVVPVHQISRLMIIFPFV
jgi:hypothetical protein